ncbi:MAG: AzlD domain-containing protein [Leptolinea sp.]|jgi:branched-subunit amino acid transport protein|nr:AzlD domain-containing protein [Leptolinea sp.]
MDTSNLWLILILGGLGTYLLRLSFILIFQHVQLPAYMDRILRLVPPAVFSAMVLPELLVRDGSIQFTITNLRLVAGLLATVIALKTRSVLATIASGMVILWILQIAVTYIH